MLILCAMLHASAAPIDFEEAIARALDASPGAAVLEAEQAIRLGEAQTESALDNPQLELERIGTETEIRVGIPIPLTGTPLSRLKAAAELRRAARARGEAGRAELAAAVGAAYLDAMRTEELAELARGTAANAERIGDAAARLEEAGELSRVDRAVTQALAAQAIAAAAQTEQEAIVARMQLEVLLGLEPKGELDPTGWPTLEIPTDIDPAALPAVRAARHEALAARAERTQSVMERIPTPELTLGQVRHDEIDPILGLAIEVPLFAPGVGEVRATAAEARLAWVQADRLMLESQAAVHATALEVDAAQTAWQAASAVPGLDEALTDITTALELGEFSVFEYTTRREALLEALTIQIEARHRLETARLALWQLAGELPEVVR